MSSFVKFDIKEFITTRAVDGEDLIALVSKHDLHNYELVSITKVLDTTSAGYSMGAGTYKHTITFRKRDNT